MTFNIDGPLAPLLNDLHEGADRHALNLVVLVETVKEEDSTLVMRQCTPLFVVEGILQLLARIGEEATGKPPSHAESQMFLADFCRGLALRYETGDMQHMNKTVTRYLDQAQENLERQRDAA
jgi:hypothetical protein